MSYLYYLNPVAHEISSQRRQICRFAYIGHVYKLEGDVVPQDDSMSYLNPVTHEISSRRRQICRRVLHGYFHPMATLSYIGHLFKLEGDVVPQDDSTFLPQNRQ